MKELNKEFTLPGNEWVDTDSDDLLSEWAELQRIIKREIHLPAKLAKEVIEKSVRDCVGMTIQPRKVIPELLFEETDELDSNQLTERSSAITVNRFLVWSMVRYMEKKEKESLKIADAKRIIEAIDDKIVENYHPLNWLSLVKPLYELSGSTVHSELFRLFFEHKGRNPIAKEFDLINGEIKESKFVEILSSPDSMYVEGYVDDQQTLFKDDSKKDEKFDTDVDEDLIDGHDEEVEDTSDPVPFHLSFSEERKEEDPVEESGLRDEKAAEVRDSEFEERLDEDDTETELKAPWDEEDDTDEGEERIASLLDAYSIQDESTSESEELIEEDPDVMMESGSELSDEEPEEMVESGGELYRDDLQKPDAALLEVEDEEDLESDEEALKIDDDSDTQEDDPDLPDSGRKGVESAVNELPDEDEEEPLHKKFALPSDEDLNPDEADEEDKVEEEDGKVEEEDALINKFLMLQDEDLNLEEADDIEVPDEAMESESDLPKEEPEAIVDSESELPKEDQKEPDATLLEVEDEEILESEEDEEDEDESSLLNRFMFDESDPEDPSIIEPSETQERVRTIYDELNLVRNDAEPKTMDLFGSMDTTDSSDTPPEIELEDDTAHLKSEESGIIQKFSDIDEFEDENDSDESDVPMWKSFLEREEEEVKSAFQFDDESEIVDDDVDSDEKLDEDGYIEEPIYDLTRKEPDLNEKIGDLSHWMQDVREKFIEELFGDSEDAYEQALSDIVEFDDWKNASRYIEKEIFTRNRIDVYDEIAVDFTDRLHSYFIENKS